MLDTLNKRDGTFVRAERDHRHAGVLSRAGLRGHRPQSGAWTRTGALLCIDAARRGDVTGSGKIWCYQGLDRTLSTVSIADGLLYVADVGGRLHCLDAGSGRCQWIHETQSVVWGSTLVADGKVYLPTANTFGSSQPGKEKRVLDASTLGRRSGQRRWQPTAFCTSPRRTICGP